MPYQPFTYQPMLRQYYGGAQHVNSVADFGRWFKRAHPQAYTQIAKRRPDLLDGEKSVSSGKISPRGLSGFGQQTPIYEYDVTIDESGAIQSSTSVISQWGRELLDIGKGLVAVKSQQDLIRLNIARAEQGLAPIDASAIAPQVNVGLTPQMQTMGIFAIGALVVVGVLAAMRR